MELDVAFSQVWISHFSKIDMNKGVDIHMRQASVKRAYTIYTDKNAETVQASYYRNKRKIKSGEPSVQ